MQISEYTMDLVDKFRQAKTVYLAMNTKTTPIKDLDAARDAMDEAALDLAFAVAKEADAAEAGR